MHACGLEGLTGDVLESYIESYSGLESPDEKKP